MEAETGVKLVVRTSGLDLCELTIRGESAYPIGAFSASRPAVANPAQLII